MEQRPQKIRTTAEHNLYVHWPVEANDLETRIPAPLTLDTYDGTAWVGITPFVMSKLRPRGLPSWLGVSFPELHVRTYVRNTGTPGIFLFSLDIGNRLVAALARRVSGMPYHAAAMQVRSDGNEVRYASRRRRDPNVGFHATYAPTGTATLPDLESFEHWFHARDRLFGISSGGTLVRTDIALEPGPIRSARATLHANTLGAAAALPKLDASPRIHYRDCIEMTSSTAKPVETTAGRPP